MKEPEPCNCEVCQLLERLHRGELKCQRLGLRGSAPEELLEISRPSPVQLEARRVGRYLAQMLDSTGSPLQDRLAVLHGNLENAINSLSTAPEIYQQLKRSLLLEIIDWADEPGAAADTVPEIARLLGAEMVNPREGDQFSTELHDLLRVDRTARVDFGNRVARCFTPGLRQGGQILRKAEVSVYR